MSAADPRELWRTVDGWLRAGSRIALRERPHRVLIGFALVLTGLDIVRFFLLPYAYQTIFTDIFEIVVALGGAVACGFAAVRSSSLARQMWATTAGYLALLVLGDFHGLLEDLNFPQGILHYPLEVLGWCIYLPLAVMVFFPAAEEGRVKWTWLPAIDFSQVTIAIALTYFRFVYLHHGSGGGLFEFGSAELVRNVLISSGLLLRSRFEPTGQARAVYRIVGGSFAMLTVFKGIFPGVEDPISVVGRPAALIVLGMFAAYWAEGRHAGIEKARPADQLRMALSMFAAGTVVLVLLVAYDAPSRYRTTLFWVAATSVGLFILRHSLAEYARYRTGNELRNSERDSRVLFESAILPITILDPFSGRVLEANQAACELYEVDQDHFVGADFNRFLHVADGEKEPESLRPGVGPQSQTVHQTGKGREIEVLVSSSEIEYRGQAAILSFTRDITEVKRATKALAESEDRYRDLVEHSEDLVCTHDLEGHLLSVNPAPARILGYAVAELLGVPMRELAAPEYRELFDQYLARIKEKGSDKGLLVVMTRTGQRRIWEYSNTLRTDGVVSPVVRGMAHDVTDRRRAEMALRSSEGRYRTLFEKTVAAVGILSLDGRIIDCNDAWARMFGHDSAMDCRGGQILDCYSNPAQRQVLLSELTERGVFLNREWGLRRKDGSPLWVLLNSVLIEQRDGEPLIQSTMVDITARKQAEERLWKSEEHFRILFEQASDGIFIADEEGKYLDVNSAGAEMLGYMPEEIRQRSIGDMVIAGDRSRVEEERARLSAGQSVCSEWLFQRKDGSSFPGEVSARRLPDGRLQGILRDITERRRAQDKLQQSQQRLQLALQAGRVGAFEIDIVTGRGSWMNDIAKIWGTPADMEGDLAAYCWEHTYPDDLERVKAEFARIREGGEPGEMEFRIIQPDGNVRWIRWLGRVLRDPNSGTLKAVGVNVDITDSRLAEAERAKAEAALRELVATVDGIVWEADGQTFQFTFVSQQAERILGYGVEEWLLPNFWADHLHPDDRSWAMKFCRDATREKRPHDFEYRMIAADGKSVWLRDSVNVVTDPQGAMWLRGIMMDLGKQKQTEQERKQAQDLVELQKRILEMIAKGLPLEETLTILVQLIESQCKGLLASIVLLDEDGVHMRGSAAPSLPGGFAAAIDGAVIGPKAASCGTAMYRKELVIVTDVLLDPLWEDYRDLATAHGVRACWSSPILSHHGKVLGSFAMYHAEPYAPGPAEMRLVEVATRLASIAIERKQAEALLRRSEERFRVALKNSPVTVFHQDRELRYTWIYNPQLHWQYEVIGKTDDEILGPKQAEVLTGLKQKVLKRATGVREEVAFRQNGSSYVFDVTIEPLFDAEKNVVGITAACVDVARLREMTDRLQESRDRLAHEKSYLESEIRTELGFHEIIGQSASLREVLKKARIVAPTDSTVLLLGETGTGKELVARSVHALSGRRDNTFIKLNCAAVPSGLLESELFGHEKGAFTGAVSQKVGRIELADKGTLFLDEIGELPPELQPKLLRVLQDLEFERLGGVKTLRVDVRIISATNRDLHQEVVEKKFREDLFYRLNVFPIELPPLRERRDDIPMLVQHFVRKHAVRMGKRIDTIPEEAMHTLRNWNWPGNVRELENMIERMVIMSKDLVLAAPPAELSDFEYTPEDNLTEMEREHILRVLRETNGVLSGSDGAAFRLGLKRTTLQSMIKRLGIQAHEYRDRSKVAFGT